MDQVPENNQERTVRHKDVVLGISIVNYYSLASIELLVASLADFTNDITTRICIVDNSVDGDAAQARGLERLATSQSTEAFSIEVIRSPINLGYGAGNNLAVTTLLEKGVKFVWILNPDILVSGRGADTLDEIRRSKSQIWATSTIENGSQGSGLGTLNTITGKGSTSDAPTLGRRFYSFEYPAGHSILFAREAWTKLGGFDDRYFLFMEEADMTLRACKLGIPIGTLSSVNVSHNQGLTTGSTKDLATKSTTAFREATKSRVIFFRRFYPLRLPFFIILRLFYALLIRAKGNSVGSKAVLDGLLSGIKHRNHIEAVK